MFIVTEYAALKLLLAPFTITLARLNSFAPTLEYLLPYSFRLVHQIQFAYTFEQNIWGSEGFLITHIQSNSDLSNSNFGWHYK